MANTWLKTKTKKSIQNFKKMLKILKVETTCEDQIKMQYLPLFPVVKIRPIREQREKGKFYHCASHNQSNTECDILKTAFHIKHAHDRILRWSQSLDRQQRVESDITEVKKEIQTLFPFHTQTYERYDTSEQRLWQAWAIILMLDTDVNWHMIKQTGMQYVLKGDKWASQRF